MVQVATYQPKPAPSEETLAKYINVPDYRDLRFKEIKLEEFQQYKKFVLGRRATSSIKVNWGNSLEQILSGRSARAYMAADALFNKVEKTKLHPSEMDNTAGVLHHLINT